jgi:endonuclease/exonuclease/phosphatase family metal-dependent hydrolase
MRKTVRRSLVAALFALVGALFIGGAAHAQTGCTSPDPFASLGGGTCFRGGWLPPGMPLPTGVSPSPPPPASPRSAPSQPSTCVTPDPFAALGGGTCYEGGWLPPGMAAPGMASGMPNPGSSTHTSSRGSRSPNTPSPESVDPTPDPIPTSPGAVGLRVLEWNTHHGVGTDGRYDLDRLATWMARMKADVIMLNEVEKNTGWGNEDQPARYEALLEAKTGRNWYHMFTQEFGDGSANGKGHLILSAYPIDGVSRVGLTPSAGLRGAGAAGEASITVNGRNISLVISHLDPESRTMRQIQAKEVMRWAANYAENRIIAGDMNAWPDQSSIAEFTKEYHDSWAVAHGTSQSADAAGATRKGRIDYIFYSKGASQLVFKSSKVYDTRDASGHKPSDHRPVVSTFEVR